MNYAVNKQTMIKMSNVISSGMMAYSNSVVLVVTGDKI